MGIKYLGLLLILLLPTFISGASAAIYVENASALDFSLNAAPVGLSSSLDGVQPRIFIEDVDSLLGKNLIVASGGLDNSLNAVRSRIFTEHLDSLWSPQMKPYSPLPPPTISVGQGSLDLATENHFIDTYNRNGGINVLGNPATEVHRAWGYLVQDFPGASGYGGGIIIYNTYQKYAYYIHSEIWERYYSLGGPNAKTNLNFWLGPPTSDIEPYVYQLPPENSKYGTPFRYQKFEGGNLELNVTSGNVFEVHGGILQKWRELGYAASNLGLPTTDEREAAVSHTSGFTGRYSVFEGGIIHWIRERNEIFVIGLNQPEGKKIADKYYAEGGSGGWLGFPVSDDYINVTSGYLQVNFENGYITTKDGINYGAYTTEISIGPTIKINYPPNNFHTDQQRITLAGIADSDAPIMRIDARITPVNGNPYYYSKIPYGPTSNEWNTNVGLKFGLNVIDVSAADGNFHGTTDTINVYYDEPDFSFVHMTDVHVGKGVEEEEWYNLVPNKPGWDERKLRITKAIYQIKNRKPKPEFILVTGDLVDRSSEDYFKWFNDIFKDAGTVYILPGNHDRRTYLLGGNEFLKEYSRYINKYSNINYIENNISFPKNGYLFIGMDSGADYDPLTDSDLTPEGTGLSDNQLEWLYKLDKIIPKIIFMHHPAINNKYDDCGTIIICESPSELYGGNDSTIANNREAFIDYSLNNNVQFVLTGHTHEDHVLNSYGMEATNEERPLFIQTPSLSRDSDDEKYNHGYRYIDITNGVATAQPYTSTEYIAGGGKGGGGGGSAMGDYISSNLACPANLHVYDSQGRHTGLNSSGGIETNIPDSFYIGRYNASDPNESETIFLYNTTEEYRFEITANLTEEQKNSPENESFNFTMDRQSEGIRTIESFQNVTLNENTTATLQVNITTEKPNMSLDYNGDRLTDQIKDPNSIQTNYAPTAAIISPEIGSIYNESEIVEFNGTGRDPEDGILANYSLIWYSDIDGTIGSGERFSNVNLSAGSHIITLMVNDSMYLYGASSMTITIADTAPPVTTLTPSGTPGNNSGYISDVNVTLKATDTQTGSGVNITEYSFDNSTWTTYINPFNITSEGITTVYYRSSDNASNIESTRNQTIKIDKTLPASILNPQAIAGSSYINFTWTNPLDPDFNHVMLFINGAFLTNNMAPQNYYNFTGLDTDTVYELGTHTVDTSGNINQTWVNATVRTASDIITPTPSITVISPDGGENWARGTTQTIRWNYSGTPGSFVNITLLKDGVFNRTIKSSTLIGSSGSGSYSWLINPTQALGTDYKIMVTSTTNPAFNDTSNNNFNIPAASLTIVSPDGEESLIRGTTQTIKWNSSGSPGAYVKIELMKSGVFNRTIIASTPNDGTHPWLIPATQAPGTDYKVKITSTTNASYNDTSDNSFTIPVPSLKVVFPNGKENWTRGTTQTIRWNSTENPKSYVKIELLKSGIFNRTIIASTLNDGSHPWLILPAQAPGTDYKIRISSTTNLSNNDTSDNNFTIPVPSFTVVSPNGSENWTRGTTQTIRWNSTESPGTYVKIELLKKGVANKVIISSTLNDGSHPWLIPGTQVPGDDYRVKITSTINTSINDTSDGNFTIPAPSFTVSSPNGLEKWVRGTTKTIRWNSTESPGTYVKIELLKSGILNRVIIASTLNDGSHPWLISDSGTRN